MTTNLKRALLAAALLAMTAAPPVLRAQSRESRIGYVYPAGGRRGTTFKVSVGGQWFGREATPTFTGDGVSAKVLMAARVGRNLQGEEREAIRDHVIDLLDARIAEAEKEGHDVKLIRQRLGGMGLGRRRQKEGDEADKKDPVELPELPELLLMEEMGLRDLAYTARWMLDYRLRSKRQPNSQLSEVVLLEVTIDPDARPGNRELRLNGPSGMTNPVCFQVGTLPEVREEEEAEDPRRDAFLPPETVLDLPVLVNGQVMPGDIDRIRFNAGAGQKLVIRTHARELVPFLADAVPGWFQPTVALYGPDGDEVVFEDDFRFDPDPVILYEVETDGIHELKIRDSIYRGREDFVYRVAIGELPFITNMFPLGGREGAKTVATIEGWNLPVGHIELDTAPGGPAVRSTSLQEGDAVSNTVRYAVDSLEETTESEPNDDARKAQRIEATRVVNGRIDEPGDVDVFVLKGRKGQEIVVEASARRLWSPLDSLVRVTNAAGEVVAWNDDHMFKDGDLHPDMGTMTHHADSYLMATLPADGDYFVQIADARGQGGPAYAYRLRLGEPQPDYELRISSSCLNLPRNGATVVAVHALRKDGFDGPIDLGIVGEQEDLTMDGARIPARQDAVRFTVGCNWRRLQEPAVLQLQGVAQIEGRTVTRPVQPADDTMQAFLWRHLVPAEELLCCTGRGRWSPITGGLAEKGVVRIPAGGSTTVALTPQRSISNRTVSFALNDPPAGITLGAVKQDGQNISFEVAATEDVQAGLAGNLIVDVTVNIPEEKDARTGKVRPARSMPGGVLPAVPFEVVAP